MNFKNIVQKSLPFIALLASGVATLLTNKSQERQMEEAITKKVAEALADKAKEV